MPHYTDSRSSSLSASTHFPFAIARTPLLATLTAVALGFGFFAFAQQSGESQDETLTGDIQSSGGYGAPTVALTTLDGKTAVVVGGQGGWVLNRHFVIGGVFRGIAPRPDVDLRNRSPDDPESARLQLGYTGLLFEYIGAPSNLLHYGAELVVGGGVVELVDDQAFRLGVSVSEDRFDRSGAFVSEVGARRTQPHLLLPTRTQWRIPVRGWRKLGEGRRVER